jgi:peptidoglycan/LPS O-acetylase OafA/YrhL
MNARIAGSPSERRIPELDGLRGTAIAMVMVFHYFYLPTEGHNGLFSSFIRGAFGITWSGVDLFFVLSGFLIGGILLDARASVNYFRVFYIRRFFRIVPIYAAILLLLPLVLFLLKRMSHHDFPWLTGDALPWFCYWTFAQNFWMSYLINLGANGLKVTWSLAVEEQFYLTLPILVRLFTGAPLRSLIIAGTCAAPIFRVAIGLLWHHNWVSRFVLMPCRADALLLGVLVALSLRDERWRAKIQKNSRAVSIALPILFLGAVALTIWSPNVGSPGAQSLGYSWLAIFYANLLVYALSRPSSTISRILRVGWLRWLGSIAYGTYLLHQIIQGMLYGLIWHGPPQLTGGLTLLTTLASALLTLVIARLSWRYFEWPLVKLGHQSRYESRWEYCQSWRSTE